MLFYCNFQILSQHPTHTQFHSPRDEALTKLLFAQTHSQLNHPNSLPSMASSILLSKPFLRFPKTTTSQSQKTHNLALGRVPTCAKNLSKSILWSKAGICRLKHEVGSCCMRRIVARASIEGDRDTDDGSVGSLIGEESAAFDLGKQKITSWIFFGLVLGVVLFVLDLVWIDNSTGYGKDFINAVGSVSDSHEVVMLLLILIFAGVHSGLASLRDSGEKLIGERAFRVVFAGLSLPLAISTIVYFINHRYDGVQLWQIQGVAGVHELVWISNFISFLFLYPSTFNLLEVAAVDKPKMHLWETGIMRITRHPQLVGQVMWCLAHSLWIGNSVTLAASVGLIGHHLFGVWNGDRRLAIRYGEGFEVLKSRTSVIPFAAIVEGRQKLPKDYYKEFIKLPYFVITVLTIGAYFAHPLMQAGSYGLHW